MAVPTNRGRFNARRGQRCFYIVITAFTFTVCFSEKAVIDVEDGKMTGYHCEADPRCLCFSVGDQRNSVVVCEDKVLLRRMIAECTPVYYEMECMGETEVEPYQYLSKIISANFSAPSNMYTNRARLDVSNCSAPSPSQLYLFGNGSSVSIGGLKDLPLEILTIDCQQSINFHLSKEHLSGLKQLKKLTLICPKLAKLDEDLLSGTSKRLENLEITDTQVRDLPERFLADMEAMKSLDLRRNKLKALGRHFLSSMRSLEIIDIGENEVEIIDDDVFLRTERLTHVQLAINLLKTLPTSLCRLKKLETLYAEHNMISSIPQNCLHSLPALSIIYLNDNQLLTLGFTSERTTQTYNKALSSGETLPDSSSTPVPSENLNSAWNGWSFIKYLRLDNNSLSSLPDEAFYGMQRLETLNISSNRITHLPDNIFSRNRHLTVLLASDNLFTNVSATLLRNITRLRKLDLSHNFIETLDLGFFSDSTSLCHIHINNNRIRHLPEKIFQPFETRWNCKKFVLDMSGNRLDAVPELSLPRLTYLDLSENNLTVIEPGMLSQTPRLLELNLSHNHIHTIVNPLELDEYEILFSKYLDYLQVIDLSSNRLTVYPSITPILTTLKHLNLSGNYITEFALKPEIRRTLSTDLALETFDVSRNRLKSVEFFGHWLWDSEKTKYVDLSHNLIDLEECREYVHVERFVWGCLSPLHKLTALEVAILSHNRISYVPMEFQHYLPNLHFVDLSHNKIKRLWHGDLLFTRARDNMDLKPFRRKKLGESIPDAFRIHFPGSRNLTIDLRHNSIASMQLPDEKIEVVIPGCDIDSKFSRVKLLLGHNPFVCDCEVFKLLRYASLEMRPTSALERLNGHRLVVAGVIDIQDLQCSEPDSVNGKAVADVESWAFHWLPMIGLCGDRFQVQSLLGHNATNTTEVEATVIPPS